MKAIMLSKPNNNKEFNMKTSQFFLVALLIIVTNGLAACTAKVEGPDVVADLTGGGQTAPGFDVNALNGTWSTGCVAETWGGSTNASFTLSGGAYQSTAKVYSGSTCAAGNLQQTQNTQGKFVMVSESSTEGGSYNVDIEEQKSGYVQIISELVRVEGNNMYFGDDSAPYNGMYPSKVDKSRAYKKSR